MTTVQRIFQTAAALVIVAFCCGPSSGQNVIKTPGPSVQINFEAEVIDFYLEQGLVQAVGNVVITWKGSRLRCRNAVIWLAEPEGEETLDFPELPGGDPESGSEAAEANSQETTRRDGERLRLNVREIYAEGIVVLSRVKEEQVFRCHRLYLDLVTDRGLFLDAALRARVPRRADTIDIVLRAGEIRQLAADRYELLDASFTTSPSVDPGYRLFTPEARIDIDEPRVDRKGRTIRNVRWELDSSVLFVGDLPVFKTPPYSGQSENDRGGLFRRFEVDNRRQFGPSARLTLGQEIRFSEEPWGDLEFFGQYLGDRGPGVGIDLRYGEENYEGRLRGIYQRDRGRDDLFGDPPDRDRGRIRWFHRHLLPEQIQLDLEVSKSSDRGFLPEYFEGEFKSEKEEETLLYAKRAVGSSAVTFLANTRLNDYQTQNEFQPRGTYDLISYPILNLGESTSLYFDANWEVSRVRRRFDDDLGLRNRRSFRADLDQTIALPFFLGPVKLEPFTGIRYTRYSDGSLVDRSFDRVGTIYGARAASQFSRVFDVTGGLFNLDGLRHIVTPGIEYRNVAHVSHDASDFIQFDEIDAYTETEEIVLRLRNRLQTVWYDRSDDGRVVDLVDLDILWTYYPSAARDNFGNHAGNLDVEFDFQPIPELIFTSDFEYSFVLDELEIFNMTVGWSPDPELLVTTGYRRYVGVNDAVFVGARWGVTEKIDLEIYSGYDFQEDELLDQRLTIQRIGEDWVFEVEVDYDNSGGVGFGIAVRPRALFKRRLRVRSLREEPLFDDFRHEFLR